jgi:hypothetical protein
VRLRARTPQRPPESVLRADDDEVLDEFQLRLQHDASRRMLERLLYDEGVTDPAIRSALLDALDHLATPPMQVLEMLEENRRLAAQVPVPSRSPLQARAGEVRQLLQDVHRSAAQTTIQTLAEDRVLAEEAAADEGKRRPPAW